MAKSTVGIKMDEETRARLKKLGDLRERSPHWLMCQAIDRFLDAEERYEQEKAADRERWERYVDSGVHLSDGEMKSRLESLASKASKLAKAE